MFSKIISLLLIVCIFMGNSQASVSRAIYHNDAHMGKCFVNENLILSPGEVAKFPERCSEIHCTNEEGHAQVVGCGKFGNPRNCTWNGLENVHAPFPLCCVKKFVCDNPADEEDAKGLQNRVREMFRRQLEKKEGQ